MDHYGNNIPLSYIHAYHSKERELYSRMVLNLQLDPDLSMDIVAFWLWQEERGHTDIIQRMNSLDDPLLVQVAAAAHTYIETLRLDPSSSSSSSSSSSNQASQAFREQALRGIEYYRNSVCHKALHDIQKKAEEEEALRLLVNQMSQVDINHVPVVENRMRRPVIDPSTRLESAAAMIKTGSDQRPYNVPHGEGTSRRVISEQIAGSTVTIADIERAIQYSIKSLVPQLLSSGMIFNPNQSPLPYNQHVGSRQHNIPIEERTLFVTFSNGYPLTQEELYTFFMRNYGDVESVTIEEPGEGRPPLYAHVSFYSLGTVLRVLDGNLKVKFMMNGKHLWARRFFPKKNHDKGDK